VTYSYERDAAVIYRQSFAIIRAEADLAHFAADEEPIAVRMIHACGWVGLASSIVFTPGAVQAARRALAEGAPILCDARMVSEGITRQRLPAHNPILCTLHDPGVPELARRLGTTRSAAAVELWRPHLMGAVVVVGNAPTALFHLLEMLAQDDCPQPSAIIGCPVGFVGAAESKEALLQAAVAPAIVVRGRLGGSAIAVAALNALACEREV
jgi:precorrin-8X/cobalt-precorrin-8 methylmutase